MKHTHLNTKGFTLVELIVVITILSILGAISFIAFQGISADSRDAKRRSDIANISKAINISTEKGVSILSFVNGTGSTITWTGVGPNSSTGTRISISGVEGYNSLSGSYAAGDINYTILGLKKEDFSDPLVPTIAYKIGATNYNGSYYELAATSENGGNPTALVTGTWNPRKGSVKSPGDINSGSTVFTLSGIISLETGLRVNDIIEVSNIPYTISNITMNTLQISPACSVPGVTIYLHKDETDHIIKRWGTNANSDNYKIDTTTGLKGSPYNFN